MSVRRCAVHVLLALYLSATLSAFVFTVSRVELLPRPLFWYSYGMMAPYQGYAVRNAELRARGRTPAGEWETIDLYSYIPAGRGEYAYRGYQPSARYSAASGSLVPQRYRRLAALVHEREPQYGRIELYFDTWPKSPVGYYVLRREPFTEAEFLATSP